MGHHLFPPLVVLHPGHGDLEGGSWDPGVVATVGGARLEEAKVARAYAREIGLALVRRGWGALLIEGGRPYSSAHTIAVDLAQAHPGPTVYLACHCNGGGGRYGLVEHDSRSTLGRTIAEAVAAPLRALPELAGDARVRALSSTSTEDWIRRGWATIGGMYAGPARCAGVLLEPAFLDQPRHASLWVGHGLERLAGAIAQGLDAWAEAAGHRRAA